MCHGMQVLDKVKALWMVRAVALVNEARVN